MSNISTLPSLVIAAGLIGVNRALLAIGARKRIDSWRRAAGLVLNTEASTFVLSAFGLNVWSDVGRGARVTIAETRDHVRQRLANFFETETVTHVAIRRQRHQDHVVKTNGPKYTLAFESWVDGSARFVPPTQWESEPANSIDRPLMNFVCRVSAEGIVDVWARVNHVGADGVPAQEVLTRLEAAWGAAGEAIYPSPETFLPHETPRPLALRPDLVESQVFIDFAPLLAWRKHEARRPHDSFRRRTLVACQARTIQGCVHWYHRGGRREKRHRSRRRNRCYPRF